MKTHFPREREKKARAFEIELRAAAPASKALWCAHPQQQSEFGGGHSNNDSIHSFTPIHLPTIPTTLPFHSTTIYIYLHRLLTFQGKPITHPLSHIITPPLWKCVSLPLDTTRRSPPPQSERANKQTNGVWCRHPTHYYFIDSLQNKCLCEARRHLCLTTIPLDDHVHTSNKITYI